MLFRSCEAMEKLMDESRNEGREEGREEGRDEGRMEAERNTILRLFHKGKKLVDMMDATDWTKEQILSFLQSKNLQIVQ